MLCSALKSKGAVALGLSLRLCSSILSTPTKNSLKAKNFTLKLLSPGLSCYLNVCGGGGLTLIFSVEGKKPEKALQYYPGSDNCFA